ncbi:hypothetical protein RND71_005756 [Anisodus tanguticus]|uniref:Uncharacterized protein n=1 Tax=Anisodus tanguticus TaxID=243964 RepID=A0AAE1SSJ9_9SOLA|nr:hypothetical protein RND71_005756 [Anisodus tanguticus]
MPYIRSAIDVLASANLPIWITELDVSSRPNQSGGSQELKLQSIGALQSRKLKAWTVEFPKSICTFPNHHQVPA